MKDRSLREFDLLGIAKHTLVRGRGTSGRFERSVFECGAFGRSTFGEEKDGSSMFCGIDLCQGQYPSYRASVNL